MVTEKQLEVTVRDSIESLYSDRIEERIKAVKAYHSSEVITYDEVLNYITNLLMDGFDDENVKYVESDYLSESEQMSRLDLIADCPDEYDIGTLLDIVKQGYVDIDYYDSDWLIESIAEKFAVDDIWANSMFTDSYNDAIYLHITGCKSIKENIQYYSDNLTEAGDEVYADIDDINIDDFINKTFVDYGIIKYEEYSHEYQTYKNNIDISIERIKHYLKRLRAKHEEMSRTLLTKSLLLDATDELVMEVLTEKIDALKREIDMIDGTLEK